MKFIVISHFENVIISHAIHAHIEEREREREREEAMHIRVMIRPGQDCEVEMNTFPSRLRRQTTIGRRIRLVSPNYWHRQICI